MPTFRVTCELEVDGPNEQTVAGQLMDITELVSAEMEDRHFPVELAGFKITNIEED